MSTGRYVTGILIGGEYQDVQSIGLTVEKSDKAPIKTGLVDHRGVAIYRVPEMVQMGFHRRMQP